MELALRLPMEYMPDPRTIIEDDYDREKEERDRKERARILEEDRIVKETEKRARQEQKMKMRQLIEEARATGEDVESIASSTFVSEKSGVSKKTQQRTPAD